MIQGENCKKFINFFLRKDVMDTLVLPRSIQQTVKLLKLKIREVDPAIKAAQFSTERKGRWCYNVSITIRGHAT